MTTFREYVYNLCENTDFNNKQDAISTVRTLALKAVILNDVLKTYEDILKDLLTYNDFVDLTLHNAENIFHEEINALEDEDFKAAILQELAALEEDEEDETDYE